MPRACWYPAGPLEALWLFLFSCQGKGGLRAVCCCISRAELSWVWDHLHGALGCQRAFPAFPIYTQEVGRAHSSSILQRRKLRFMKVC